MRLSGFLALGHRLEQLSHMDSHRGTFQTQVGAAAVILAAECLSF